MKLFQKLLFCAFLIYCNNVTAQYVPAVTKTSFNSFVQDDKIEWASYTDETRNFQLLTHLLLQKQFAGKIKGFLPVENGVHAEDNLQERDTTELKKIFGHDTVRIYDSSGNFSELSSEHDVLNELNNSVISFSQILYIKNGELLSYIPRVSVRKEITTAMGTYIGVTDIISYCINKKYNSKARKKDKLTFLGSSKKTVYPDSIPDHERIKFLFGKNLVSSLAPYILSGKLTVYAPEEDVQIMPDSLLAGNYPEADIINVPVYDSTGKLGGTKALVSEFSFSNFKRADLTEEFFYDETKNIIICKIPEMLLFKYGEDPEKGLLPSLRIVF